MNSYHNKITNFIKVKKRYTISILMYALLTAVDLSWAYKISQQQHKLVEIKTTFTFYFNENLFLNYDHSLVKSTEDIAKDESFAFKSYIKEVGLVTPELPPQPKPSLNLLLAKGGTGGGTGDVSGGDSANADLEITLKTIQEVPDFLLTSLSHFNDFYNNMTEEIKKDIDPIIGNFKLVEVRDKLISNILSRKIKFYKSEECLIEDEQNNLISKGAWIKGTIEDAQICISTSHAQSMSILSLRMSLLALMYHEIAHLVFTNNHEAINEFQDFIELNKDFFVTNKEEIFSFSVQVGKIFIHLKNLLTDPIKDLTSNLKNMITDINLLNLYSNRLKKRGLFLTIDSKNLNTFIEEYLSISRIMNNSSLVYSNNKLNLQKMIYQLVSVFVKFITELQRRDSVYAIYFVDQIKMFYNEIVFRFLDINFSKDKISEPIWPQDLKCQITLKNKENKIKYIKTFNLLELSATAVITRSGVLNSFVQKFKEINLNWTTRTDSQSIFLELNLGNKFKMLANNHWIFSPKKYDFGTFQYLTFFAPQFNNPVVAEAVSLDQSEKIKLKCEYENIIDKPLIRALYDENDN